MHYVLIPDGRWLLMTPGAFTGLLCGACLFGFAWGSLAAWSPHWVRRLKPRRRDRRGRWS